MPQAPKIHRPFGTPQQTRKEYDRRRGTSTDRGYGPRWNRYRKWYFSYPGNVLCGIEDCHRPADELDHVEAVSGPHDPRFFDPTNTSGLCREHHSIKTAIVDGGFGNQRTPEGVKMLEQLKRVAVARAKAMDEWDSNG